MQPFGKTHETHLMWNKIASTDGLSDGIVFGKLHVDTHFFFENKTKC